MAGHNDNLGVKLVRRYYRLSNPEPSFTSFELSPEAVDARRSGVQIEEIFFEGGPFLANKWLQYFPVYERYFAPYRDRPIRFLEIGVFEGGSLEMWRRYFGAEAVIYGVDINPDCADHVNPPNQVRIGSQDDGPFLANVVDEMGPLDIILDDGSHIARHQRASFRHLWERLKPGGLYCIEDTHTSYWPSFDGGYRRTGTAIELAKELVDDLHGWYHNRGTRHAEASALGAVHFHDSLIVIEKVERPRPGYHVVPASRGSSGGEG